MPRALRSIRLKDGRLLEFAEYGDPRGRIVFFFHGFFGSMHQGELADDLARRSGIRVIAPNRPGIGRSAPCRLRFMTDYAEDIRQLADHLGAQTAVLIGASGGGSYALACAHALGERVPLVGVFGGIGPLDVLQNLRNMQWLRRAFLSSCHLHPRVASAVLRFGFLLCRRYPRWMYDWLMERSSALEADLLRRREVRAMLWRDFRSVFLQGNGIQGILLEAQTYFHWGFDLRDFPSSTRVIFWHGSHDTIVPWSVLRRTAARIPHADVIVCPGGHLSYLMKEMETVLRRLRREWDAVDRTPAPERLLHRTHARPLLPDVRDVLHGSLPLPHFL